MIFVIINVDNGEICTRSVLEFSVTQYFINSKGTRKGVNDVS